MENNRRLSELCVGERARVSRLLVNGSMRRRLLDIGISPGAEVCCIGKSPFGDPSAYLVRGCAVAIRGKDAHCVIME